MDSLKTTVRIAREADAQELLEIYAPYVTDTAVSFEYEVPSRREFARRIRTTLERYPFLVAERGGQIAGYTYASPFKGREAYDWAVETTIYIREELRRDGVGGQLYQALEALLRRQNICNANACIAHLAEEDIHLNHDSERFHERMGYRKTAHFTKCGYKFNTWYDMIWMEKMIGPHITPPKPVVPFLSFSMEELESRL